MMIRKTLIISILATSLFSVNAYAGADAGRTGIEIGKHNLHERRAHMRDKFQKRKALMREHMKERRAHMREKFHRMARAPR